MIPLLMIAAAAAAPTPAPAATPAPTARTRPDPLAGVSADGRAKVMHTLAAIKAKRAAHNAEAIAVQKDLAAALTARPIDLARLKPALDSRERLNTTLRDEANAEVMSLAASLSEADRERVLPRMLGLAIVRVPRPTEGLSGAAPAPAPRR
ncbi:hypothetical protein ABDK56_12820 [Sphingomonas sp. ASV193]|uniref:hypothetical protein n=1 Tax=Sphingomonas sp. ASV193 TaxID=3144405 RepID=UPI0032E91D5E